MITINNLHIEIQADKEEAHKFQEDLDRLFPGEWEEEGCHNGESQIRNYRLCSRMIPKSGQKEILSNLLELFNANKSSLPRFIN